MRKRSAATDSMVTGRYDQYVEKILSLRRTLDILHHYRILLILVAALILGAILSLMAVIGHFTAIPTDCTYFYGETPSLGADAFLSGISYEFSQEDSIWHAGLPQVPGTYRVRALSINGFGKTRHSKDAEVTILPRSLSVTIRPESIPYGDSLQEAALAATAISGLSDGDQVAHLSHDLKRHTKDTYAVTLSDLRIQNAAGQDVTDCYTFIAPESTFTVIPRPVTVQTENANKVYDGQPWTDETVHITAGSLLKEHTLQYTFPQRPVDVDSYIMLPECKILDAEGGDVTENYALSVLPGKLEILHRPLSLSSARAQKVYDGTPLVNAQWEILEGTVAPEQQLVVEITGTLTNVGTTVNSANVRILDAQGTDVTYNYVLSQRLGELKVLPRPLTLSSNSAEKVYDGTPLSCDKWQITDGSLAPNQQLVAITHGTLTDAGSVYNTLEFAILDNQYTNVTDNYAITLLEGKLNVLPRPLTLSSGSAEKIYDGTQLSCDKWQIVDGTIAPGQELFVTVKGSLTDAGIMENTLDVAILDANGQVVTKNYALTLQHGKLIIHKRPITLSTGSAEKVYDATPLTCPGWQLLEGSAAPGQTLSAHVTGSQTAAGTSKNTLVPAVLAQHEDVTRNYEFTLQCGDLTVTPITLVFHNGSAEKVYDGKALSTFPETISGQVVPGHRISFSGIVQIVVGTTDNIFTVGVYDQDGREVTDEGYIIEITYGTLTVTPRPITIQTSSAEKLYDGNPLTCHEYIITTGTLAEGDYLIPSFTGSQTKVGSSDNTMTAAFQSETSPQGRTNCYDITYEYGTLTVLENPDMPEDSSGEGDGEGTGEGGTEDGGSGSGSDSTASNRDSGTTIGFPGHDEGSGAPMAYITGKAPGYQNTSVYFRDMCFGDYTGSGWEPATKYSGNPYAYLYQALLHAGVDDPEMEIKRLEGCSAIVPYFSSLAEWDNDCYLDNGYRKNYTVSTCIAWDYRTLRDLRVPEQHAAEEAAYRDFVYQNYLQIPDSTKDALLAWAAERNITADSADLVELIQVAIQHAATYNLDAAPYPEGVDVAVYFLTTAKEGICQHFATAATLLYRAFGIPARYTVGYLGSVTTGVTTELTTDQAHAWVEIYVDGLGWVPLEVTGSDDQSGENTTPGAKISIDIQAASLTKYYDGKPFSAEDITKYAVVSGQLLKGHTLEVTIASESVGPEPGSWISVPVSYRVLNERGVDVTATLYDIHIQSGTLTILRRKITITTGSASKYYDGRPLSCSDYWISQGSLAPGEMLQLDLPASLTDPGTMTNQAKNVKILRSSSNNTLIDTTECYEIIVVSGTLQVYPPLQTAALLPKKRQNP